MASNNDSVENRLVAVGDIMLGDSAICVGFGFHSRYPGDASRAFANVAPRLRRGEIVFGNLECLLVPSGRGRTRLERDQMRGDPEYARALRSAGFTALSVANNHAMQHGRDAFNETIRTLGEAGIACVGLRGDDGWCSKPVVVTTRTGLRVGLLGYSWRPRQYDGSEPPYAEGDAEAAADDVRRLRDKTDAVVVSLHWGEEFFHLPSVREVESARGIVDAGAKVIVGHHPHVMRPIERYGDSVICYSLGNFVTDMLWQSDLRHGGVLECRLGQGAVTEIAVSGVRADDEYRAVWETTSGLPVDLITGVEETAYSVEVANSLHRQQRSAYAFAARNLGRYPPSVLSQMALSTLRNKISALRPNVARNGGVAASSVGTEVSRGVDVADADMSSRPLAILHVVAPAPFGGLETVVRALAAGHAQRGHSVHVATVISPSRDKHPFVAALEADGISTFPVIVGPRDYRGERMAIRELWRMHRPDLVHTHGFRSDVVDGRLARADGIAVVSTCHGFIEGDWRGRFYQWVQRRALRGFDAIIAVSATVEKKLREAGVDPMKIHLVRNGFAPTSPAVPRDAARRMLGVPDGPAIGWVGRLSAEKGADVALEAFSRISIPGVHLVMVGEGRDISQLRDRATALGISDRVFWCGAVPSAGRLFSAFDAFLLSSRTEGTPMALLEAMSANVPIVATRVGGVPDVVDESVAWLVDSEDVAGMARAVEAVLAEPPEARARANRARARLEEAFGLDPWLSRYEALYREVLGSRAKKRWA